MVPDLLCLEFQLVGILVPGITFGRLMSLISSVFEYTYLLFWNSFWTIAPVIGIGLFDRFAGELITNFMLASFTNANA